MKQKKTTSTSKAVKAQSISGSETISEKFKRKMPWIFGGLIKKPKINFPKAKYRRILIPMPAKTLGIILIYVVLFILQTGVVYLIYRKPPALGANPNGDAIFIYPSVNDSFIIEGIVASVLIFVASMGYLMLYQASKYLYNRKMALRILIFGITSILLAFISLQYMIAVKTGNVK
ncbi:MAG: hypothetical protein ACP6IY_08470 [Promethearchaeia archaeon]